MNIKSGIAFNGKHSYHDFGLTIASRDIGNPSKIKVTEKVPYSHITYDFSMIYGDQEYEERPLTYVFNLIDPSNKKENYFGLKDAVINWLSSSSEKSVLKDDKIKGYYFLAEVENGPDANDNVSDGTLSVSFKAYPFKIAEYEEGDDIWDTFNFLLDHAQQLEFAVVDSLDITIYNPGAKKVNPRIVCSSPMQVIKDNITYNIPSGESTSYDFSLNVGENNMKAIGNGTISFHFRKEII